MSQTQSLPAILEAKLPAETQVLNAITFSMNI